MSLITKKILLESARIKSLMAEDEALLNQVEKAGKILKEKVAAGGTIYACGNGGSACDAVHLTEELVARFKRERPGIRAMHFLDSATMSCWGNDYDFNSVFARQAETFCKASDVLIAFSTSGNSENILQAVYSAKQKSTFTIGLTGKGGGKLREACDLAIVIPSKETERIQEAHITLVHIFCEMLET